MSRWQNMRAQLAEFGRDLRAYLFGKGIVSTAIVAASFFSGGSLLPFVIAAGGVGLHMYTRRREQNQYLDKMVVQYREEIGLLFGIDPASVTRAEVKLAAYGDVDRAVAGNPILAQAIDRQRAKSWLKLGTSLIAAGATLFVLSLGGAAFAGTMLAQMSPFLTHLGASAVALTSGLFIQNGLEFIVGQRSGIGKAAANDLVLRLERRHQLGRAVTPEEVMAVKLAAFPALAEEVRVQAGRDFLRLRAPEQQRWMARLDPQGQMTLIADEVNKGTIDVTQIPFIITGQIPIHQTPPSSICEPVSGQVQQKSFAERLGLVERVDKTHVARVEESRTLAAQPAR
jgi:hypothetical protein